MKYLLGILLVLSLTSCFSTPAKDRLDQVWTRVTADGVITAEEQAELAQAYADAQEEYAQLRDDLFEGVLAGLGAGGAGGAGLWRLLQMTGIKGVMKPRKVVIVDENGDGVEDSEQ